MLGYDLTEGLGERSRVSWLQNLAMSVFLCEPGGTCDRFYSKAAEGMTSQSTLTFGASGTGEFYKSRSISGGDRWTRGLLHGDVPAGRTSRHHQPSPMCAGPPTYRSREQVDNNEAGRFRSLIFAEGAV